jgi:hypothetical protein
MGIFRSIAFASASESGGQPTGTIELATALRAVLGERDRVVEREGRLGGIGRAPGALDEDLHPGTL